MSAPTEPTTTAPTDDAAEAEAAASDTSVNAAIAVDEAGEHAVTAPPKKSAPKDPLHGVTLEMILTSLVEKHGWEAMARVVDIKCFTENPSIKSSLTFLRRTPWARTKVEQMYVTNDLRPAWRRRGRGLGPRS